MTGADLYTPAEVNTTTHWSNHHSRPCTLTACHQCMTRGPAMAPLRVTNDNRAARRKAAAIARRQRRGR